MTMGRIVIALGFFESVHLGHAKVIRNCVELAKKNDAKSVVVTFDDSFPKALGYKDSAVVFTLDERIELYKSLDIDDILVLPSDSATLGKTVDEFHSFLLNLGEIVGIVAGEDFSYGINASGNVQTLHDFAQSHDIAMKIVDFERINGIKIGSSSIKQLISCGDMIGARNLLGRDFYLDGVVVHGRGQGHCFGIPTANIQSDISKIIPAGGVYATVTAVEAQNYLSLTSIGTQPTFNCENYTIETMILGFSGDIYGKSLRIYFKEKLRDVANFGSIDELKAQIDKDIKRTRERYGATWN